MEIEIKTLNKKLTGIGDVEISILQLGDNWHLREIEDFVLKSDENFYAISRTLRRELCLPINMQRAIQTFVDHIQSGGEKQTSTFLRSHFRNWLNRQTDKSFKQIISENGKQSNQTESGPSLRENVQSEFNRRYGNRQ